MFDKINLRLLDLLTILLPGGFMLYVCLNISPIHTFWDSWHHYLTEDWHKTAVFIGSSFVLGHFVYLIASAMDYLIFEKIRKVYYSGTRLLAYILQLKKEKLGIDDPDVINAFKWSLAILIQQAPELYAAVEQHIGASKFFRSFFVVLILAFFSLLYRTQWFEAIFILVLAFLSLIRYISQRIKSIESTYQYVLVISERKFDSEPDREILTKLEKNSYQNKFPEGVWGQILKVWIAFKFVFGWKGNNSKR